MRIPHSYRLLLLSLLVLLLGESCSNEKVIEVDLPEYESQMVVECYLEPGKPLRLLLQESVSYFQEPELPLVEDALVIISHDGQSDTLTNDFAFDFEDEKFYNYAAPDVTVPYAPGTVYELYIRDQLGRELTGRTVIMDTVAIRPIEIAPDTSGEYSLTIRWPDVPNVENYYRFTLHRDTLATGLDIDFLLDDRVGDGDDFVISTFFFLDPGDSVICSVYHIEESYWRYLITTEDAADSNGNPFAQPGNILSNVEGGIGIFSGLTFTRRTLVIPE